MSSSTPSEQEQDGARMTDDGAAAPESTQAPESTPAAESTQPTQPTQPTQAPEPTRSTQSMQSCGCDHGRDPEDHQSENTPEAAQIFVDRPGALITEGEVTYYRYPLPASFRKFRARTSPITTIVLHFTGSPNQNPEVSAKYAVEGKRQASYHFLVGRGEHARSIIQLVAEEHSAWHTGNQWNHFSIGIEHAANDGEALDPVQEQTTIGLIKLLLRKYNLTKDNITGHRFTGTVTNCPGWLFGEPTEEALRAWVDTHFADFTEPEASMTDDESGLSAAPPGAGPADRSSGS